MLSEIGWKRIKVAMQVLAALLLLILLWRMHPFSKRGTTECVFRIAKDTTSREEIRGDGVRLTECVTLEKVVTPSSQIRGLSGRDSMPWDRGMLFDFKQPDEHCMWMKDMKFSIDMLWLDEGGEIVGMKEDISPDTYPTTFCGPENARYVIEVNAGAAASGDLRIGQRLNL